MSPRSDQIAELQFAFSMYEKTSHGDWLAGIIRSGGATNIPWPVGLAEALADLIEKAVPWTSRDQTQSDDTWIFYLYWRETEYRTGEKGNKFNKRAIREIENWFEARGTPKEIETIQTRLRSHYVHWRSSISEQKISEMMDAAGDGEKS